VPVHSLACAKFISSKAKSNRRCTSFESEVKAPPTSHFEAEIKAEGNGVWMHAKTT
jgi:hypothetical protein